MTTTATAIVIYGDEIIVNDIESLVNDDLQQEIYAGAHIQMIDGGHFYEKWLPFGTRTWCCTSHVSIAPQYRVAFVEGAFLFGLKEKGTFFQFERHHTIGYQCWAHLLDYLLTLGQNRQQGLNWKTSPYTEQQPFLLLVPGLSKTSPAPVRSA